MGSSEPLIGDSRDGPIEQKTFFSKSVGRASSGQEVVFILHTRSARSCKETGEKLPRV